MTVVAREEIFGFAKAVGEDVKSVNRKLAALTARIDAVSAEVKAGLSAPSLEMAKRIDGLREELKALAANAATPADLQELHGLFAPLDSRISVLRQYVDASVGEAKAGAAAALAEVRKPTPPSPPPPAMPDFLVDAAIKDDHLIGVFKSGATKDLGQVRFKPRRTAGGGRASSQQQALWSAGGIVNLTYATPTQPTVGAVASTIVQASSASFRRVTITVPTGADTGIYCNPNGVATSAHQLIQPGGAGIYDTRQAISAIRAGASDVTAFVQIGTA